MAVSSEIFDMETEQRVQAGRIERTVRRLLNPRPFAIWYMYFEGQIQFRVDSLSGQILADGRSGSRVSAIKDMSDEKLEDQLRELLDKTRRISS
ncbi:MAG: hypothetical protein WCA89_15395 [Terracidiphilus sp.]